MKKFIYPLLLVAAIACNKNAQQLPPLPEAEVTDEITFTTKGDGFDASVQTKASAVTSLSSFNVLAVTGTAGSAESTVFNSAFSGTTTYTGGKYWPSTDRSYHFYASNASIAAAAGGPTIAATNDTDIVCAFLATPTYKASNALVFNHIFARIGTCKIAAPSGYTVSNLSVKVTPNTGGTYSLFAGNGKTDGTGWSGKTAGSATTIASALNSTTNNDIYLVPGSYSLSASYTLTKGDYTESFTKTANVSLVAGKVNNISSTLPAGNAVEIQFSVSVTPWSDNNISASFN